ncbi:hypothetical protein OIV83_004880 [Microbotryomycetes sp. JL201]|nr:hypothetical protein OIV83_004880 [Microbotryomycetes sp. JL201]
MSLPPLHPGQTNAGISRSKDGERVVAASRRPDGTLRKELRVRPGFTPDEDVQRFRSQRMAQAEARAAGRPKIPGLPDAAVQAAIRGAASAGSSTKTSKVTGRKVGNGDSERLRPQQQRATDVPDSWDEAESNANDNSTGSNLKCVAKFAQNDRPTSDSLARVSEEPEKKIRALKKKLRQAELLQERERAGLYLPPSEKAKAACVPQLEAELASLSLTQKTSSEDF